MPERHVLLFVKYPEPGLVKTRLAAHLGDAAATALYRAFVADELAALAAAAVPVTAHCAPPHPEADYRAWLGPDLPLAAQRGGDLGARMAAAFEDAFAHGADEAVLIGSDIPALTPAHVTGAFAALGQHGAALAPAGDGGYTLIAFTARAYTAHAFADVPWSTTAVLSTTLTRLREAGRRAALLPVLPDVDEPYDLARLAAQSTTPAHTLALLQELAPKG